MGRGVYIHQAFAILRITRGFRRIYVAGPICVLEQVVGIEPTLTVWKTVVLAVIRYLHFVVFFRFLHIYYTRNFKKNQILLVYGGRWWNRIHLFFLLARQVTTPCSPIPHINGAKSRARTYDLSGMNRLL